MGNPKVSIIIPVYNGSNFLKEAIESALGQTYENIEIIVVNDGSNDGGLTETIALSYGEKIRYFKKENGGVATALNLGIREMKGEYFSWLSHDDLYVENKIEVQIEALLENNTNIDIAYSDYTMWYCDTGNKVDSDYLKIYKKEDLNNGFFSIWLSLFRGCTLLIHKRQFERVGLFNEDLITTQDEDMWFRIFEEENALFIPQSLVITRIHPKQGSRTIQDFYSERVQLYERYLCKVDRDKILTNFGNEYHFYSLLLERFRYSELFECIRLVEERIKLLEQPTEVETQIKKLHEYICLGFGGGKKDICIWGAGFAGKLFFDKLKLRNLKVKAFIDNDIKKQGTYILGVPCLSPLEIDAHSMGIIISMKNLVEIEDTKMQLEKLGIINYITYDMLEKHFLYTEIKKDCLPSICNKKKKVLSVAWCIYDERILEFSNNCTGGGLIIRNICEYIGRKETSYLFIGMLPLPAMKLGNISVINTISIKEGYDEVKRLMTEHDFNEFRLQYMCKRFEETLENLQPDIVNFHGLGEFMYRCIPLCEKHKIPFVVTEHLYIGKSKDFAEYESDVVLEQKILNRGNMKLIAVSTGMKNKIIKDYPCIMEKNIRVILNSTDFEYQKEKIDIYSRYGIDKEKKILLCVGTLTDRKNQSQIIHSFYLLEKKMKQKIVILFCGNDRMGGVLQRQIKELNLEDSLLYVGSISSEDMKSFYAVAHGLIMASRAEGLSIAALEAIRYGLPVIMYQDSECALDLCDENVICYSQGRTEEDLKEAIIKWYKSIWDRDYIKRYSRKFDIVKMVEDYVEYYEEIINENPNDVRGIV